MKTVIHSLISYNRTGYVKRRYIGESVCLIDDLVKYAEDENIDGILFAAFSIFLRKDFFFLG